MKDWCVCCSLVVSFSLALTEGPLSVSALVGENALFHCTGSGVVINPRPEGYGSRLSFVRSFVRSLTLGAARRVTVVVLSFVRSFVRSVHCATESSAHFFAPVKVRTG